MLGSAAVLGSVHTDIPQKTYPPVASCVQKRCVKPTKKVIKKVVKRAAVKRVITNIQAGEYEPIITRYAQEFGVDANLMKKIARCESHFNPMAANGQHKGMYQYANATWVSTRKQMGLDTSLELRHNAEESIKTTAFKISHGGINAWRECL